MLATLPPLRAPLRAPCTAALLKVGAKMIEKKAVPAASVEAERGGNCSMLAEIQDELYGDGSPWKARSIDSVCLQLANLRKWAGADLRFKHSATSAAVSKWNTDSAPFREAIKLYLAAYENAANAGGGIDAPISAADAARIAAMRSRQTAARLGQRMLSVLSQRKVGAGAPPDDVLNVVVKLAPHVANELLRAADLVETPAEIAALDEMWDICRARLGALRRGRRHRRGGRRGLLRLLDLDRALVVDTSSELVRVRRPLLVLGVAARDADQLAEERARDAREADEGAARTLAQQPAPP